MKGISLIGRLAPVLAASALVAIALGLCGGFDPLAMAQQKLQEQKGKELEEYPVPFKPLPKTITPCRACHGPEKDFKINWTRTEVLRVHTNIRLKHGGVRVWCLDCHSPMKRNYLLPLSDGKPISFQHSYELCGKCHGTKYRDWRNGIHGKRTGFWNGKKQYLLCINCHNPHAPLFKPLVPMPPPKKPRAPKEDIAKH
jgi:hypothetical protein